MIRFYWTFEDIEKEQYQRFSQFSDMLARIVPDPAYHVSYVYQKIGDCRPKVGSLCMLVEMLDSNHFSRRRGYFEYEKGHELARVPLEEFRPYEQHIYRWITRQARDCQSLLGVVERLGSRVPERAPLEFVQLTEIVENHARILVDLLEGVADTSEELGCLTYDEAEQLGKSPS